MEFSCFVCMQFTELVPNHRSTAFPGDLSGSASALAQTATAIGREKWSKQWSFDERTSFGGCRKHKTVIKRTFHTFYRLLCFPEFASSLKMALVLLSVPTYFNDYIVLSAHPCCLDFSFNLQTFLTISQVNFWISFMSWKLRWRFRQHVSVFWTGFLKCHSLGTVVFKATLWAESLPVLVSFIKC